MPANIKFLKYKLTDSQQQTLFETDFQSELVVKQPLLNRVMSDLVGFTATSVNPELSSVSELDVGSTKLQLTRRGSEFNVAPDLGMPPSHWITQQLGIVVNTKISLGDVVTAEVSKDDLLRVVPNMLSAYHASVAANVPEESDEAKRLRQKILELGGEEVKEVLELKGKIRDLEKQLSGQRQIDEIEMSTVKVVDELAEIDRKLVSVNQLVARQKQIETILSRYGKLLQVDLEKEGERLCTEITTLRTGELQAAAKHKDGSVVIPKDEDEKPPKFLMREILGMAGVSVVLAIGGFLLVHDLRILILGPLFAVLELALLAGINFLPAAIQTSHPATQTQAAAKEVQFDRSRIPLLEKFFVDKAWVAALRGELASLAVSMTGRLEGKDYEQLKQLRELVQSEFDTINTEIGDYKTREIQPEDYLRKRRELDSMKIKKSKLETTLASGENFNQIQELIEELDIEVPVAKESFMKELNPEYSDISSEKGQIVAKKSQDTRFVPVDLSAEDLKAMYVWMRLNSWAKAPTRPLIIIKSSLASLSERGLAAISAKISQLQNLGQVITVTVQG